MNTEFGVVDLFAGCGGLSEGFRQAGFNVVAANDNWKTAADTFKANHGIEPVVESISDPSTYAKLVEMSRGADVVIGGPPCQSFSTAGRRLSVEDPRGNLVLEFIRFVKDTQPKAFVMENVRGILSAAIRHRPLKKRGNGIPLSPDEELGSALRMIMGEFDRTGYSVNHAWLNAADYGVPQKRHRVILIGIRDGGMKVGMPKPTHSEFGAGGLKPWVTLREALVGLEDTQPAEYFRYSDSRAKIFKMVPPGGNWRSLPKDTQKSAMGGAYNSTGGRVGFYRRLSFDKPSPTLVTSPVQNGTALCHPTETRPLTVMEYARVQQFPDHWQYHGSTADKYKQIGNAVPVGLAKAVAESVKRFLTLHG